MADVQDQGVPFPTAAPPQQPLNLTQMLTQAQPPQFDPAQYQAIMKSAIERKQAAEEKAANNSLATLENDRRQAAKMLKAEGIGPEVNLKWDEQAKSAEYSTDPMQAFGSIASVFAILASSFTRAPMANALNGAAAAMNGIKQRDDNAYKRGFEAFKTNAELALKRQELMHQQYGDALELMKVDATIGRARMDATARKFGDELMLARIEAGADPEMWKLYEDRLRTATELPKAMQQVYELDAKRELSTAQQERAQAKTPEEIEAADKKIMEAEQKVQTFMTAAELRQREQEQHNMVMEDIAAGRLKGSNVKEEEDTRHHKAEEAIAAGKATHTPGQEKVREATEAENNVEKLKAGQTVDYGGYTFTPKDYKELTELPPEKAAIGLSPRQKALDAMLKLAAKAPPEPPAPPTFNDRFNAVPQTVPVPEAFKNYPDGKTFTKDGKRWIKRGNTMIELPTDERSSLQTDIQAT